MQSDIEQRPRLLIVEDDPSLAETMREALEDDFRVDLASDGSAALDRVRASRPDVVLLDAGLPRLGGVDACRALRNDPSTADLPIIVVTGDSSPHHASAAFAAGATDYMQKPFSISQLRSRTRTLLLRRRAG